MALKCYKGNVNDSKILLNHLKNGNIVHINHLIPYNNYFLADPGYDTKLIRDQLEELNYNPLIAQNKRNIKNPNKIIKLNNYEKKIYNKRLVIERTFNKMKMNRKLCLRYESKIKNFIGFIYLSLIKMLC